MHNDFDVIVVGLGGMGSSAAYHLAGRGSRVLGLERFGPAHDRGSSHGHSRVIRQAYFENPAYVPLLLRAYELWERLEQESGETFMDLCGGLMIGRPDSEVFSGTLTAAREHKLEHEVLSSQQVRERFPALNPADGDVAFYERLAGWINPEATVKAHLAGAASRGAELHYEEPVLSWTAHPGGDGATVVTAKGTYTAAKLVIAPGAWAPEILADLGLPLQVERQILFWFQPTAKQELFHSSRFPIYIFECENGAQFYGFPAQPGVAGVKVAFFRLDQVGLGQNCTPETIDRTVHPHEIAAMREYLRERVPLLNGDFLDARTCFYTNTPDQHFVIASHPGHEQVTIACGFSGHGYKFASVVGEILADLTLDGNTRHDIGLFTPARLLAT